MNKRRRVSELESLALESSKTHAECIEYLSKILSREQFINLIVTYGDKHDVLNFFYPEMESKVAKWITERKFANLRQYFEIIAEDKGYRRCEKCNKKYGVKIVRKCSNCDKYVCKNECDYTCVCGKKVEKPQKPCASKVEEPKKPCASKVEEPQKS